MFRRRDKERVPVYKQSECLGSDCQFYNGENCNARLELLEATGKSGSSDKGPYVDDCRFALYGKVCMGGDEQLVVGFSSKSPNGQASMGEMIGRAGVYDDQRIVLSTPPEDIKF